MQSMESAFEDILKKNVRKITEIKEELANPKLLWPHEDAHLNGQIFALRITNKMIRKALRYHHRRHGVAA